MNKAFFARKSKYKSKSCKCSQGHWHHSRGEAQHCNKIAMLVKAKYIKEYDIQKKFSLDVNGVHITNHFVDFWVTGNSGRQWVEEFKGVATSDWKLKHKLFEAIFPDIEYKIIYYRG